MEVNGPVQGLISSFETFNLATEAEEANTGVCSLSVDDYARVVALSAQSATTFCDSVLRGR